MQPNLHVIRIKNSSKLFASILNSVNYLGTQTQQIQNAEAP